MMQEIYDLSRDEMEELSERLRHPSRQQLLRREEMMRALRAKSPAATDFRMQTEEFEELDLSFLQQPFCYRQTEVLADGFTSGVFLEFNGVGPSRSDVSYQNRDMDMTAA